jgi:DNA-binding CsgD family transcriptional regulator
VSEVGADELSEFARRVLVHRAVAAEVVTTAVSGAGVSGLEEIVALAQVCREVPESAVTGVSAESVDAPSGGSLAHSVAAELDRANASLTRRQREILALRELLGLSYDEISRVMGLEVEAVCAMLARGRLQFRAKLRGVSGVSGVGGVSSVGGVISDEEACPARDQALQVLARGLDREAVPEDHVNWLFLHIAGCESCQRAHSEMHEASVVYRAWVWR